MMNFMNLKSYPSRLIGHLIAISSVWLMCSSFLLVLRNQTRIISSNHIVVIVVLLQDGAGRVGKMLFARQGKKFDNDLKQVKHVKACLHFLPSSYLHHFPFLGPMCTTN